MIETSERYNTLFDSGAIQDYRIVINGIEYTNEHIYDTIELDQDLFDKPTFTVGSFAISSLKTRLILNTKNVPHNASIEFYYRYNDGTETSEWIQKFSGSVVDRKQFNDSVIEITAMDKGYNYDVFLDNIVVDEYPANARDVAIKCATHLGVELVNPSDIINQNIVDYPNELTIVEVLKNIAKSSGGNFTMLGDGRLKLVVLKNRNLIKDDFSDFNAYQGATITRNKTFPIEVFKGGRNYLLNSGETTIINPATMPYRDMGTLIELQPNVDYVFSWNIDWLEETTLPLLMGIGLSRNGIGYNWDFPMMGGLVVNKNETQFRTIRITQAQYDDGLKYFAYRLRNRNQLMTIELNTRKFEKGSTPTEYSPAPEDGYDYQGSDGAWHITTSGGNGAIKYISLVTDTLEVPTTTEVNVHTFNPLRLFDARDNATIVPLNRNFKYKNTSSINTVQTRLQFRTENNVDIDQPLDFIASDPSITNALSSFPAQSVTDAIDINQITMVTAYWDDESAFQVGTTGGSDIIIDNPWATQLSTDYVYSVLNGFKYKPISGKGVYLDPKYELGDYFSYGSQDQLVAKISWNFGGTAIADVDAPISTDSNFDDPYQTLKEQAFKRKVTLGNSYQGVSISRENGIQMLYSPDGTEENALGRYYADLEKGIAFQTRNSPNDDWMDWMYLDIDEATFKLALYSTTEEVDGIISDANLQIQALANSLNIEITTREEQGDYISNELSTQIEALSNSFQLIFTKLENDLSLTDDELTAFKTYYRWDADGAIIGKSGSPVEFFQTNEMIGFRENGVVIAQWERGTQTVDNLIAKVSIVIGTHQVEKYDSPVAGVTSILRRVNT